MSSVPDLHSAGAFRALSSLCRLDLLLPIKRVSQEEPPSVCPIQEGLLSALEPKALCQELLPSEHSAMVINNDGPRAARSSEAGAPIPGAGSEDLRSQAGSRLAPGLHLSAGPASHPEAWVVGWWHSGLSVFPRGLSPLPAGLVEIGARRTQAGAGLVRAWSGLEEGCSAAHGRSGIPSRPSGPRPSPPVPCTFHTSSPHLQPQSQTTPPRLPSPPPRGPLPPCSGLTHRRPGEQGLDPGAFILGPWQLTGVGHAAGLCLRKSVSGGFPKRGLPVSRTRGRGVPGKRYTCAREGTCDCEEFGEQGV